MISCSYRTLTFSNSLHNMPFYSTKRNILCHFMVGFGKIQYQHNDFGEKMRMFIQYSESSYEIPVFACSLVCINYCIFKKSYIPR